MRALNRLSATRVAAISQPGRYADGGGLWLQVSGHVSQDGTRRWITKSWVLRYMRNGRARTMGLGPVHAVPLAVARDYARKALQLLCDPVNPIDPIEARRARKQLARAEATKMVTFRQAAERHIGAHRAGWRNAKHADQWLATLEKYAFPTIGDLPVAAIDVAHVTAILEPIWTTKTETASRVRGRVEAVLDWATARGLRQGANPARWRGHLEELLPSRRKVRAVRHMPAMPYAQVPAFFATLRAQPPHVISAHALRFTILTACRTGEVIGALWQELDLAARTWTIPARRTKSAREHRVPLSDAALQVLQEIPREVGNPHIFIGGRVGAGLSNMAMLELLRGLRPGLTVHGFRSSFRDWCAEQTSYPREIAEAALAHALRDKTEAAYQRGDLLEKRRRLMQAWGQYCSRGVAGGEVLPLQGRTAS